MDDDALTRRVLACCYAVHRELGTGYPETTYQHALTRELEQANLPFKREEPISVIYRGEEIDLLHADFVIEQMLLEVIAKSSLEKQDVAQAFALLRASGLGRGLLVNFGVEELQTKRLAAIPRPKAERALTG